MVEVVEGSEVKVPLTFKRYEWRTPDGARELAQELFGAALIGSYEPDEVQAYAAHVISRLPESGWELRPDEVERWLTEHRRRVFDEGVLWSDGRDAEDELPGSDWEYDWEEHGK